VIVLDTHAWVWWVNSPKLLSRPAIRAVDDAAKRHELFVSTISAWEMAMLVEKGRLELTMDIRDWIARCEALPFLSFVPLSPAIAVESVRLPDFPHSDPADRIIVATAMTLGARLVTKDSRLMRYKNIRTVW
jgi:PIN domain nuclease of toxin-antitoxin system